jgi:hypothetical protein
LTFVDEMGDFLWFYVRWQDNCILDIAKLTILHPIKNQKSWNWQSSIKKVCEEYINPEPHPLMQ